MFLGKKCFDNNYNNKDVKHVEKRYLYWDWFYLILDWNDRGSKCECCGEKFWDDQPIVLTDDDIVNKYNYRNLDWTRD